MKIVPKEEETKDSTLDTLMSVEVPQIVSNNCISSASSTSSEAVSGKAEQVYNNPP